MNKNPSQQNFSYLLWPLAVLFFLTIGVFITTREVPKEQDIRSRADEILPSETPPVALTESPTQTQNPTPAVQTGITLSFSLPGISSQGGNIKPLHSTRDVTLFFYDKDINTSDPTTKPLFTFHTQASFDADPQSSTYAQFVHKNIDFDNKIPPGDYQVGIKTDQAIGKILKRKDTDLRGILFTVNGSSDVPLSFKNLISGDFVPLPHGNDAIDIADYNEFMNCFGAKAMTDTCTAKVGVDLDDNGSVDGIDYNITLLGFKSLLAAGYSPPALPPTLSPSPTLRPSVVSQPKPPVAEQGNAVGVIVVLLLFVLLSLGIALLFRKKISFPRKSATDISEKEYYIKKKSDDEDKISVWLTLADDSGQTLGHYKGFVDEEGFAHIKGVKKTVDGKTFIEISEIIWDKKD